MLSPLLRPDPTPPTLWRFSADTGALGNLRAFGNRLYLNLIYKDAPLELTVLSRFKDYTA